MSSTATYLNFAGNTEEVFNFYKSVFGTEFAGPIHRFGDIPSGNDMSKLSESDKNLVMHMALPILGGHLLMGTDAPASMGFTVTQGNNIYISLHPDSREETETLFAKLSEGGTIEQPLDDMFWWAYYGSFRDKFGIGWMINYESN